MGGFWGWRKPASSGCHLLRVYLESLSFLLYCSLSAAGLISWLLGCFGKTFAILRLVSSCHNVNVYLSSYCPTFLIDIPENNVKLSKTLQYVIGAIVSLIHLMINADRWCLSPFISTFILQRLKA